MDDDKIDTSQTKGGFACTPSVLLTEDEVANIVGRPRRWLQQSRHRGRDAIPYIKIGRIVRYEADAVARYVEVHRFTSTSDEMAEKARTRK